MKNFKMPSVYREMPIVPQSLNEEDLTFDCDFSTGADVRRSSYWDDYEYFESLSMNSQHVNLRRLNGGCAPFLNGHRSYSVLGVVLSARIENGIGKCRVKLSRNEEIKSIIQDIKDGIRKSVSVGYDVYKYEDISEKDDRGKITKKRLLAVDWEPYEVSLVSMPADPDAKIRLKENDVHEIFIMEKEMPDNKPEATTAQQHASKDEIEKARSAGAEEERKRVSEITLACRKAKMSEEFREKLLSSGATVDQAREKIIDVWQADGEKYSVSNHVEVTGLDATVTRRDAIVNAIMHRGRQDKVTLLESAKEYRMMSLIDIVKDCLEVNGVRTRGMSKDEIVTRGLQGSSDFPNVLANVASKTLLMGYQEYPQTFLPFVTWVSASDFKSMSMVALGEAPALLEVPQSGELKQGVIKESGETAQLKTWGVKAGLTRRAIINDDLGIFTQIPYKFGVQANMKESDIFWGIITANANMADGVPLFDALHGNLGSAAVISITSLSAGRLAMMKQKGIDGVTPINIPPSRIVCPVAQLTTAQQYSTRIVPANAAEPDKFNPIALDEPVGEARLDVASAYNWYLFADGRFVPIIAMLTLDGMRGPRVNTVVLPGFDGVQIECIYDVNGKAVDYRGVYKNPYAG